MESTNKEKDVQRLTTECAELKSGLKSEQSQAKDKISSLEDDRRDKDGKMDLLNRRLISLTDELSASREEVARLASSVKALEKDKAELKEKAELYTTLHPKYVELVTQHKFTDEQNQQLKAEKAKMEADFKAEKAKLEADKVRLEATIAAKERTIENKEQTIAAKDQIITTAVSDTREFLSESRAFMDASGWQNSSRLPGVGQQPPAAAAQPEMHISLQHLKGQHRNLTFESRNLGQLLRQLHLSTGKRRNLRQPEI